MNTPNGSSSRQFAVVTGASSGIGRELAKQFASNGFDLLIAAKIKRSTLRHANFRVSDHK